MQSGTPDEDEHEEDGNFQQMYSCKGGAGCEEAKFRSRHGSSSAQVKDVLRDEHEELAGIIRHHRVSQDSLDGRS